MNGGTASTSELLTGALHAGGRAATIGEHTFGKGRTQKVLQLHDKSTLLVSNSLVTTPALERIDKVQRHVTQNLSEDFGGLPITKRSCSPVVQVRASLNTVTL